jgi:hypothetical protein
MLSGNYTFLTTRPAHRRMSRLHPEIIKVLPHVAVTGQTLKARLYYSDATATADYTIATFNARVGEVYSFQIGYPDISYPSKAVISKIELYCGATYPADQDMIIYYPFSYAGDIIEAIYYANSLAGIDSVICTMTNAQNTQAVQSDPAELNANYQSNYRNQRQHRSINNNSRTGRIISTGFLPGPDHMEALKDLFLHNFACIYRTIGGQPRYVPIEVDQNVSWPSVNAALQGIEISYRLSIDAKANSRVI